MNRLSLIEEIDFVLEEISGLTRRSSLETGFNHSRETFVELKERLILIQEYCDGARRTIPILIAKHLNHVPDPKHITLKEFDHD